MLFVSDFYRELWLFLFIFLKISVGCYKVFPISSLDHDQSQPCWVIIKDSSQKLSNQYHLFTVHVKTSILLEKQLYCIYCFVKWNVKNSERCLEFLVKGYMLIAARFMHAAQSKTQHFKWRAWYSFVNSFQFNHAD